jgi:general secretion pathway protein I
MKNGFSLLEVMLALAILAVSLLWMFMAQTRSIRMAGEARTLTVATELARTKLEDCKFKTLKEGFSINDTHDDGDFADLGYKNYTWECHTYAFDLPAPDANTIAEGMKAGAESKGQEGGQFGAGMIAPFLALVGTTLKEAIKELVVIVKWKSGNQDKELRVTTHIVNKAPVLRLMATLPEKPMLPPGMGGKAAPSGTGAAGDH